MIGLGSDNKSMMELVSLLTRTDNKLTRTKKNICKIKERNMFAKSGCIVVEACAVAFATCGAARKADMQNNALRLRLHKLMCKYQNIEILQNQ